MARMHTLIGLVALSAALTGCVSQEKYTALKLDNQRLAEQLGQAQSEAGSSKSRADVLESQLAAIRGSGTDQQALLVNLQQQNADLSSQLNELNRKYSDAMSHGGGEVALPKPLNDALTQFAQQNPDLVDFDSAHGVVKFKSDVTFDKGSAEVTTKAKEVITRFAQILNSDAARGYELLVAGHTDSTPVSNPATIAAGHKNNWYLSAHRAIAVGTELQHDGVNTQRLGCVGYVDQRPVASNASVAGQAQNRRVEVLILPTTIRSNSVAPAVAAAPKPIKKELNKDAITGAALERREVNK